MGNQEGGVRPEDMNVCEGAMASLDRIAGNAPGSVDIERLRNLFNFSSSLDVQAVMSDMFEVSTAPGATDGEREWAYKIGDQLEILRENAEFKVKYNEALDKKNNEAGQVE